MKFLVKLTNQEEWRVDADSVSYTDAPGFVMFIKDDEAIMTFNERRVYSVTLLKEPK